MFTIFKIIKDDTKLKKYYDLDIKTSLQIYFHIA